MKAILISDHAKWCALMMIGIKKTEVRKGTALYKATKKLIDEYGYAEFYVYCTKEKATRREDMFTKGCNIWFNKGYAMNRQYLMNGKVIFKFRCYNVEEIETCERHNPELLLRSCLNANEFYDYLMKGKNFLGRVLGCAIHISDLEIFDKPKELSEFRHLVRFDCYNADFDYTTTEYREISLTKAPQSWCYIHSIKGGNPL